MDDLHDTAANRIRALALCKRYASAYVSVDTWLHANGYADIVGTRTLVTQLTPKAVCWLRENAVAGYADIGSEAA